MRRRPSDPTAREALERNERMVERIADAVQRTKAELERSQRLIKRLEKRPPPRKRPDGEEA